MDLRTSIRTQPMRRFQIQIIALCFAVGVVDGFEILMMAFVAPFLADGWNPGSVQIGYLLSASIIGTAIGAIVVSPLADRIGRRRLAIVCLAGITIGMAASAVAANIGQLLAFRTFAGLGIGGIIANLNIIVAEYSSTRRRGTALGLYGSGLPLGGAVGGALTTVLSAQFGWRSAFVFGTVVTAILLLAVLRWLPESVEFIVEKRPKGALAQYNAIARRLGQDEASELPPATQPTERVIRGSLFDGVMARRTIFLWSGYSFLIAAFYFANTWTPKLLVDATGDKGLGATAGVLVNVGGVLGALLFAAAAIVLRPRLVTVLLMIGGALSFLAYANGFHIGALALFVAVLVGVFANGGVAAFYAISPTVYPSAARATGVGWMIGCGRTVSVIAPILTGYLLELGWTPKGLYMLFGGVLVLAGLAVWLLDRTFRREPAAAPAVETALPSRPPSGTAAPEAATGGR